LTENAFAYRTDQHAVIDWILEHAGDEADEVTFVTIEADECGWTRSREDCAGSLSDPERGVRRTGGRLPDEAAGQGGHVTEYLMYFNQQWVGEHTEEWFRGRGPLAMAVVDEMKAAGVYVFAGGLEEEDGPVYSADPTSGTVMITDGPYVETKEFLGGFAVVDVADDEAAKMWAGKIAEACGWPHEVRRFKPQPRTR
jgi:hypothetical protein